jgi:hypothetical protein
MRFQTGNNSLNGFNTGFKMHRVRKQWETTSGLEVWLSLSFFHVRMVIFPDGLRFQFPFVLLSKLKGTNRQSLRSLEQNTEDHHQHRIDEPFTFTINLGKLLYQHLINNFCWEKYPY